MSVKEWGLTIIYFKMNFRINTFNYCSGGLCVVLVAHCGDWAEKQRLRGLSSAIDWKVIGVSARPPSKQCQGTLEHGTKLKNAQMEGMLLLTHLVVYPAYALMCILPMTPVREIGVKKTRHLFIWLPLLLAINS